MSIAGSGFGLDGPKLDSPELSPVPVTVLIHTDRTGAIDITARGPIKGKAGLLALLDAARKIAEQMDGD